jgi:(4-(4-[2-(gamma-L-glutamylamino)ethyl]phenoxymethyl)furan-2-yl)methanamine synthase
LDFAFDLCALPFDLWPDMSTLGWDIGGVNTKVARVSGGAVLAVCLRPFELQHDPGALVHVLRELAIEAAGSDADTHAVTMTAELSQMFRTKRDGVHFVLDAVAAAFPRGTIYVYAVDGRFLTVADARDAPLLVAAANWAATARVVAQSLPDALLVDIGTTSTDIIPIVDGEVAASGWTDPDRLASGELVYSGAVRTPVEALATSVPLQGRHVGLSAEAFALSGDVHVWRGDLEPADYSAPTPDRRPPTREFAGERLARAICADREMVNDAGITEIADALAAAQAERIAAAIGSVRARHPALHAAVITGLGTFIAERAARRAGLDVVSLASALGSDAARCAPAASIALLLDGIASEPRPRRLPTLRSALWSPEKPPLYDDGGAVHTVAKVGGGLLAHGDVLDRVLNVLADRARDEPLLIIPGGGPFADAVRVQDVRLALTDDAAHWMAVLGMEQYAHLLVSRMPRAELVTDATEISTALASQHIPVLAPFAWLRRVDPLPHSWAVTSDSIAAWIAHAIGARRLVLVKPPGAGTRADVVDDYFVHVRGKLGVETISGDAIEALSQSMRP